MKKVFVSVAFQAIFSCFHTPVAAQTVTIEQPVMVVATTDSTVNVGDPVMYVVDGAPVSATVEALHRKALADPSVMWFAEFFEKLFLQSEGRWIPTKETDSE